MNSRRTRGQACVQEREKLEIEHTVYECGQQDCAKRYSSYTAFYNHCKKKHEGCIPNGSLHNQVEFRGPMKNRGRPKIQMHRSKEEICRQRLQNQLIVAIGDHFPRGSRFQVVECAAERLERLPVSPAQRSLLAEYLRVAGERGVADSVDPSHAGSQFDSYSLSSCFQCLSPESKEQKAMVLTFWLAHHLQEASLREICTMWGAAEHRSSYGPASLRLEGKIVSLVERLLQLY